MSTLWVFVAVALGGASGASARYAVSLSFSSVGKGFPWPTLCVNIAGCLAAGFLTSLLVFRVNPVPLWQLFVITGFLGGFTTFSAFSVDTLRLVQAGATDIAAINVVVNLVGSLMAVSIGWWFARHL